MTIKEFKIQEALGLLTYSMLAKLAYSPDTSKEVLTILSTDKNWGVRHWAFTNPNYPTLKEDYEKTSTNN